MPFTGPIKDRLMIRERYNAYSDAATYNDEEGYLACWSEDGVRIGQGTECRGKEALLAQWRQFWTVMDKMAFFTEPGAIEVSGDHARGHCHCREIISLKSGETWKVVGRYDDQFVRENEAWVFARREYTMLIDEGKS